MLQNYMNKWDTNNDAIFIQAITTIWNNLSIVDRNTKLAQRRPKTNQENFDLWKWLKSKAPH